MMKNLAAKDNRISTMLPDIHSRVDSHASEWQNLDDDRDRDKKSMVGKFGNRI